MGKFSKLHLTLALGALISLSACGGANVTNAEAPDSSNQSFSPNTDRIRMGETTIWNIFKPKNSETNVAVNKYLWAASLEVLSFLPVQSVDPYTCVIVTGYGTPPGGGTSYRATVLIDDPALEARSLNVALQTTGGRPVSKATSRAVEDAILSRAREIRIADSKF